jgi:hypothetical protein
MNIQWNLHAYNNLRATIYRDRSGEGLPVSVIAKNDSCKKFRVEILKGITLFSLYKNVQFGSVDISWQTTVKWSFRK